MATRTRATDVGASIDLLRSNNRFYNGLNEFNNDYNNAANMFSRLRTLAVVERERLRGADEIQLAVERQEIAERIQRLEAQAARLSTLDTPEAALELYRVNQEILDADVEAMVINGASEQEVERALAHARVDINLDINEALNTYAVRQIEYIERLRNKYNYEDREIYECLEDLLNINNNPELDGLSYELKNYVYDRIYEELGLVQGEMDVAGRHPQLATIYNAYTSEREHQMDEDIDNFGNGEPEEDEPENDQDGNGEPEDDEPENDHDGNDEPEEDEPENDQDGNDEPEDDEPENDQDGNDEPEDDEPENDQDGNDEPEDDEPENDQDGNDEPEDDEPENDQDGNDEPEDDEPENDQDGVDEPEDDEIGDDDEIGNVRPNANAKWKSILAIAAGIGFGAGVWFAFGGVGVAVLSIGGGLVKGLLARKQAQLRERENNGDRYVHRAEDYPRSLRGQIQRFRHYINGPQGLAQMQRFLTASIFSSLGFNIFGPMLGLEGGQVITALSAGGGSLGGEGATNETITNSEASMHGNTNPAGELRVGDSAGNLTSGYTDSYSAQAGEGAVSLNQSLINSESSHIGGFNVITSSGESIAVTDPSLTASQVAAQHRVPMSNVIPRIVQNGTNANQAWSTLSDVAKAQGGRSI